MSDDTRDEAWLRRTVSRAETLEEAQLAVSIFLNERQSGRARLPLPSNQPHGLALVVSNRGSTP